MAILGEIAKLIRSKNAGPFVLTFDIMFDDEGDYGHVRDSHIITPQMMASLYGVPEEQVQIFHVDNALAIKVSIPRPAFSGDLEDSDVFGGQQYGPLVELKVPDRGASE